MAPIKTVRQESAGAVPGDAAAYTLAPHKARTGAPRGYPCSRPKRIGLFGLFGCGNLGNDGSLEAMLRFLREAVPGRDLVCICAEPEIIRGSLGVSTIPLDWSYSPQGRRRGVAASLIHFARKIFDVFQTLREMRRIDLIVVPGTGVLDDLGERPWGMPYHLLKWCAAARLLGRKVAFVSIGAGPINHPVSRRLMTAAARLAHYRSYRDTISRDYLKSFGLNVDADGVYPDIAFKLPAPAGSDIERDGSSLCIGVGVMSYSGWYNFADSGPSIYAAYIAKMAHFVRWLLDSGYRVRLLTGETSDRRTVVDILGYLRRDLPHLDEGGIIHEPANSLHDLMSQIAKTDIVVATRFHNVVCALRLNRPTVSIGYAKKNERLLEEMGLGSFSQHVEQLDVNMLVQQFSELVLRRDLYESNIRTMNRVYQDRLRRQDRILIDSLL